MKTIFDFLEEEETSPPSDIQESPISVSKPLSKEIEEEEEIEENPKGLSFFDIAEAQEDIPEKQGIGKILKDVPRHVSRSISRGLETVAGAPRDLLDFQKGLILRGAENLAQRDLPWLRQALERGSRMLPAYYMSGSRDLKEGANALSRDFLAPQNEAEETSDNIVSDAVALMFPVKTKIPFWKSFLRAGGISGLSNLVGGEVEKQTGSTEAGEYAKMGTMFLTSLMSPKGLQSAKNFVGSLYEEARNAISPEARVSASKMQSNLQSLRKNILAQRREGALAPSERFVIDEIDNVLDTIKDGQVPVESAWASKRALNEKLDKLIYESPDKKTRARARNLATQINKDLNQTLKEYGNENPAFGIPFNEAEEAFATLAKSRKVSNFVRKNAKLAGTHAGGALLLEVLTGHPVAAGYTAAGIGGAAALNKAASLAYEISKSPTLRTHYLNAIKAAAQENAAVMNKNLSLLQKKLEEKGLLEDF